MPACSLHAVCGKLIPLAEKLMRLANKLMRLVIILIALVFVKKAPFLLDAKQEV
jgi:hypothetical protein